MLNPNAFANSLIQAEQTPAASPLEAAERFASAFYKFIEKCKAGSVSITPGAWNVPTAQSAFVGSLAGAFSLSANPSGASDMIGAAIIAFFNAAPASVLWVASPGPAVSVALTTPLSSFWLPISGSVTEQMPRKMQIAIALQGWLATTLVTMSIGSPPPSLPIV